MAARPGNQNDLAAGAAVLRQPTRLLNLAQIHHARNRNGELAPRHFVRQLIEPRSIEVRGEGAQAFVGGRKFEGV